MRKPRLKKHLGQHHLVRDESCAPLLEYLRPEGCRVLEVGPGGGILTRQLVATATSVAAVEMDLEWACSLRAADLGPALTVVAGDALALDWQRLPGETLVTGNLPYQIATALIERVLPLHATVPRAAFLVQREVAERLAARPGSAAYGSLSVLVSAAAEVVLLGRVARGSFRPPPKVEGAFVGLKLRELPSPVASLGEFAATVRLAFGLRRKTLRNALAAGWGREHAERVIADLGYGSRVRAEELDLGAFLRLHELRPGP
jgi:16S rRNA (adenine1518-N6/adenine1519-N6)-dimethyltransferase